jgi:WD40 repeat protein
LIEQRTRWGRGERVTVEVLLRDHPELVEDAEAILDLVLGEVLLRQESGEKPGIEEYTARFPQFAELVRALLALHGLTLPGEVPTERETAAPVQSGTAPDVAGYDILGELGRGGMSVVYLAQQKNPPRKVALKMIRSADASQADRLQIEAQAVARLQHPNIVQIFEVGIAAGQPYLALEYVAGGTLADRLARKPQPPALAAGLVAMLARAVHYAHQYGVIHRDLKPTNVLLSAGPDIPLADCLPKIADFGLAKLLTGGEGHTGSHEVLGTPAYMAPEQAAGRSKDVGAATDVYALGMILYECLTGRPPFLAENWAEAHQQILFHEPVSPRRLQPKVPLDLETICLKCLHKDPARRYPTAESLADDLACFVAGKPIKARRVGIWGRTKRWARRRPALAVLLGLTLLLSAGLAGLTVWYLAQLQDAILATKRAKDEADTERARALSARYLNTISLAYAAWYDNDLELTRELLKDCPPSRQRMEWHLLNKWCRGNHQTLQGHQGLIAAVAYSPDGKLVASASYDGTVKLWHPGTGEVSATLPGPGGKFRSVAFSLDGKLLAGGCSDGTIRLWNPQTHVFVRDLPKHTSAVLALAFHPDGNQLVRVSSTTSLVVCDVNTGQDLRVLKGHAGQVECVAYSPDGKVIASGDRSGMVCCWGEEADLPTVVGTGLHGRWVESLAFSPKGDYLATGGGDKTVQLRAVKKNWVLEATLVGHTGPVTALAFSPDQGLMASASLDRSVKVWTFVQNLGDGVPTGESWTLRGHGGWVCAVAWSRNGGLVSAGRIGDSPGSLFDGRGELKLWNASAPQETRTLCTGVDTRPNSTALSPDGTALATLEIGRKTLVVRNLRDGTERFRSKVPAQFDILAVAWSAGSNRVTLVRGVAAEELGVEELDADNGNRLSFRSIPASAQSVAAFRRDGSGLAIVREDGQLEVWDLTEIPTRRIKSALEGKAGFFSGAKLAWSPDGRFLAAGVPRTGERGPDGVVILGAPGKMVLCDVTAKSVETLSPPWDLAALAFSHDSRQLTATGGDFLLAFLTGTDKEIQVWEVATRKPLRGGRAAGGMLGYSPDGHYLVTAGERGLRLHEASSNAPIVTIRLFSTPVDLAFLPSGRGFVLLGGDGVVRLLDTELAASDSSRRAEGSR